MTQILEETSLVVSEAEAIPNNRLLVATNPAEMSQAQQHLESWFAAKLREAKLELNEVSDALEVAVKNKWGNTALRTQVTRCKGRKMFYEKCLSAVRAGYALIPEFPVDLFAVRLDKNLPQRNLSTSAWRQASFQKAQVLPEGDGRYVSDEAQRTYSHQTKQTQSDGKIVTREYWENSDFKDVVFPLIAMKPEVMTDTAQAMSLRIFDEVGLCPQSSRKDPMIIGRILGPKVGFKRTALNFLICWFIDLKEL